MRERCEGSGDAAGRRCGSGAVARVGLLQAAVGGGELGVVDEEGAATLLVHDE